MKALVYKGPEQIEFRDVADATPADGEVLVRVEACGICGSDMHAYLGHDERRPAPLILGHEAAGTVGSGPRSGERVTVNPLVSCGICAWCTEGRDNLCANRQIVSMPPREGAFAEAISIPEGNLVGVPDNVAMDRASLAEPLACGWHATRLAEQASHRPLPETRCLVLGGGAIGVGAALCLHARGATDITIADPSTARREVLSRSVPFRIVAEADDGREGFGVVIDAVGFAATRAAAFALVRPGGVIVHIGLGSAEGGVDARRATLQQITFIGSYTYTAEDFRNTAEALFDGRLGTLEWIETRPLRDGPESFADLRRGLIGTPKIVLNP